MICLDGWFGFPKTYLVYVYVLEYLIFSFYSLPMSLYERLLWDVYSILELINIEYIRSDQIRLVIQSCPTICDPMNRSTPGLPVQHQLLEFTQTHVHRSVMPSSHLILCRPLLLLPPIPPSIRVFSNESTLRMR